jgi:hypothetical protein
MAIVMLGGLVTTTLLSLFMLPALYLRFGAAAQPDAEFQIDPIHHWAGVEGEAVHGDGEVAGESEGAPERQDDGPPEEQPAVAGSALPTEDGDSASPGRSGE